MVAFAVAAIASLRFLLEVYADLFLRGDNGEFFQDREAGANHENKN